MNKAKQRASKAGVYHGWAFVRTYLILVALQLRAQTREDHLICSFAVEHEPSVRRAHHHTHALTVAGERVLVQHLVRVDLPVVSDLDEVGPAVDEGVAELPGRQHKRAFIRRGSPILQLSGHLILLNHYRVADGERKEELSQLLRVRVSLLQSLKERAVSEVVALIGCALRGAGTHEGLALRAVQRQVKTMMAKETCKSRISR